MMKTPLHAHTTEPLPKAHTIRLHFDDTTEDQALYAALRASSDREHRTPLPRQAKYLLEMAMGFRPPDQLLIDRMKSSLGVGKADGPSSSTVQPTTLRLIPGGKGAVNSEAN